MISAGQRLEFLISKGDHKGALKIALNRLRKNRRPDDYANVAGCLYKLGRLDYATRYANYALQLSCMLCHKASLVLANISYDSGDLGGAAKIYLSLVNTDLRVYAYQGLAVICQKRGNLKRAIKILSLTLKSHPSESSPYFALGQIYLELGDYREAWNHFRRSLQSDSNSMDSWSGAYQCACELKEFKTALSIANNLIALDSSNPKFYEYKGRVLFEMNHAKDCADAYYAALTLQPNNPIYYLNLSNPCARVPFLGSEVHALAYTLKTSCFKIQTLLIQDQISLVNGSRGLIPFAYYCAYSPYNLKHIYGPYYVALEQIYAGELNDVKNRQGDAAMSFSIRNSSQFRVRKDAPKKKIRIGLLSRYFSAHSNTQAFEGLIYYLNRDQFEIVLIHRYGTVVDGVQIWLNGLADESVYLWESLECSLDLLLSLSLDILFFTDLGMDPYDFMIPALRSCPIQITGWGLPHTSGLTSIDYYLSSSLLESSEHQKEYVEQLVLLDGLPCCFMEKNLNYWRGSRDYFMLPSERVLLGCTQNFWKIHPDFDLILENIAHRLPDVVFVFVETSIEGSNQSFVDRFAKRAPLAFSQSLFLARARTADFLPLCDCFDVILDTPYYGAGVTAYMSMYVGSPTVCFAGSRLRDSTTAAIYRYLSIENAPIANSFSEYVEKAVNLACDFDLRLQIKKDTVAAASKLYDNQDYVRSFERFCVDLVGKSR